MRKESKELAVTAATMKKEKRNEPAATTFVNYLESWYQNKCLSNSTSSSTAAYYYWMIFNVIEPSLPDKERAVDDIDAEYLNALLACINQKNENTAASAYRFLRVFIKDRFEPDTGDYELFFQIKNILFWKKILSFIHRNSLPAYYQLQRKTTPPTIWNMPWRFTAG